MNAASAPIKINVLSADILYLFKALPPLYVKKSI